MDSVRGIRQEGEGGRRQEEVEAERGGKDDGGLGQEAPLLPHSCNDSGERKGRLDGGVEQEKLQESIVAESIFSSLPVPSEALGKRAANALGNSLLHLAVLSLPAVLAKKGLETYKC